jgi:hypothetical protein
VNPTVFLGLVTHRRTRFAEASGPNGLVRQVQKRLLEQGIEASVAVHDADRHDEGVLPLTNAEVIASIDAELDLEARWRTYVTPGTSQAGLTAFMAARRAYRRLRLAPPWHRSSAATASGAAMLRRLVNIELAHMHLLEQARDEQAAWALIVEDDATLENPNHFASALATFIHDRADQPQPAYVNVSRSFSSERLDLGAHLTAQGRWDATTQALASDIPLTNTVCAVLYRGTFLDQLVPAMQAIPISPVLPIDWKLNAALLGLTEAHIIGSGDCWFLNPAPIVQGSMHD